MIYLVISYDIHDMETFKNYPPAVAKLFRKYGAEVLAMETSPKSTGRQTESHEYHCKFFVGSGIDGVV